MRSPTAKLSISPNRPMTKFLERAGHAACAQLDHMTHNMMNEIRRYPGGSELINYFRRGSADWG